MIFSVGILYNTPTVIISDSFSPFTFPFFFERTSTTKVSATRALTLAVFSSARAAHQVILLQPFLDSDLLQLKWRPVTISLRYISKSPPFNYQPLLYIFSSSLSLSHLAFQGMENEILIPSSVVPNAYYLRPMGDADPSDFINQETNQIPFRQSLVDLSSWNTKNPFRN